MAVGIFVKGDSGSIQIDETYKNLVMVAKGSAVTDSPSPVEGGVAGRMPFTTKQIVVTGVNPIMAVRSAGMACVLQGAVSGSTFSFMVAVETNYGETGTPFDYWIFDEPSPISTPMGLRVWNAAGELTFDSGHKYMRVADYVDLNTAVTTGATYETGRLYATCFASPGFAYYMDTVTTDFGTFDVCVGQAAFTSWSSASVTWGVRPIYGAANTTPPPTPYDAGKLMIIDVTNY